MMSPPALPLNLNRNLNLPLNPNLTFDLREIKKKIKIMIKNVAKLAKALGLTTAELCKGVDACAGKPNRPVAVDVSPRTLIPLPLVSAD